MKAFDLTLCHGLTAALLFATPLCVNAMDLADLEPDEFNAEDCQELPYFETFSDMSHFDGKSYLPINWHSVGTTVWRTAADTRLLAQTGEYYMVTPSSTMQRDETAYTPFFNLNAGFTYTLSFYMYIEGTDLLDPDTVVTPTLSITVGTEQDGDFHAELAAFSEPSTGWKWEKREVTFTPAISGPYCFSFALTGRAYTGMVAVDNIQITAPGLIPRVEPDFEPISLFSLQTSHILAFKDNAVQFFNSTKHGVSYQWSAPGLYPETSTLSDPRFLFPGPGKYDITLTATNPRGSRSTTKTVSVDYVDGSEDVESIGVEIYNELTDKPIERDYAPHFDTDPNDYVLGFNHYYHNVAQKYDFPVGFDIELQSIQFYVHQRRYAPQNTQAADETRKKASIVVYGADEQGNLDENIVYGRFDGKMADVITSQPMEVIGLHRTFTFPEPIKIKGPCFVAFEFSDRLTMEFTDPNQGRSYVALGAIRYGSGQTTLYAKPHDVPEGAIAKADGKWYSVDKIDPEMKGLGGFWHLWVKINEGLASVAINNMGEVVFDACLNGDILTVSGTREGDSLCIVALNGTTVAAVPAADLSTTVNVGHLAPGVYIASCNGRSLKFRK